MTISRREFAAVLGAGALGRSLSSQSEGVTAESVRAMLDAEGGRGIFADTEWLELLKRGVELNAETRAILGRFALSNDAEPIITFVRY